MTGLLVIAFVVVFAAVLVGVSLGMKYFEERRKKRVASVLKTISNEAPQVMAPLLIDRAGKGGGPVERMMRKYNIKAQIQQAGLSWTPSQFLTQTATAAGAGLVIGIV